MRFRQSQDASSNLVDNTADSMSLDRSIGTDQGVREVEQEPRGNSGLFQFGHSASWATPLIVNAPLPSTDPKVKVSVWIAYKS
jgi:hypothetical protein